MYECLSAAYYITITKEPILYINDHKVYCLFNGFFWGGFFFFCWFLILQIKDRTFYNYHSTFNYILWHKILFPLSIHFSN